MRVSRRGARLALFLLGCHKPAPAKQAASGPAMSSSARYAAAKVALEAGRLDEAEADFTKVAAAEPRADEDPALRANALLGLADLRKERGDAKGALVWAQKLVMLRPDDHDAAAIEAELAHEAGDLPAEIAAREQLVRLDPDELDERLALAGALTVAKEPERAKLAFLGYEDARVRLITVLGRSRDAEERTAAAHALRSTHDAGTARALALAMTDRDAGVRREAVLAVEQVGVDLDPEIRPALRKLATIERDAGVQAALKQALAAPTAARK